MSAQLVHARQAHEIAETLDRLHKQNYVPIGVLSYSVELDKFYLDVLQNVELGEADALMRKMDIGLTFKKG